MLSRKLEDLLVNEWEEGIIFDPCMWRASNIEKRSNFFFYAEHGSSGNVARKKQNNKKIANTKFQGRM